MTDPEMPIHDHDDMEECVRALEAVHAFLHGELPETEADRVRQLNQIGRASCRERV